jgi:ketosteroid isomerase-like protein
MKPVSETLSRETVEAFFEAYATRDVVRLAPFLADDVEWNMAGPIGIFRFCGYRRGKAAALDYVGRLVPEMLTMTRHELEDIVVDGDGAAIFSKLTAVHTKTGRTITFYCAYFTVFRDGKLALMEGVTDTFNIAEQVVGHRIDAHRVPDLRVHDDGLVTI